MKHFPFLFWLRSRWKLLSGRDPQLRSRPFPSAVYVDRDGPTRTHYTLWRPGVLRTVVRPAAELGSKAICLSALCELQINRAALIRRLDLSERDRDGDDQKALDAFLDCLEQAILVHGASGEPGSDPTRSDLEEVALSKQVSQPALRANRGGQHQMKEQERRLLALRKTLFELDLRLETCRQRIIESCEEAGGSWMLRQLMELVVTNDEVTLNLGKVKVAALRREIESLIENEFPSRLRQHLGQPEQWWHLRRLNQDYLLPLLESSIPAEKLSISSTLESIHLGVLEAAEICVVPLRRHGYLADSEDISEYRLTFGFNSRGSITFEWSEDMKARILEYRRWVEIGRGVVEELKSSEDHSLQEARAVWESLSSHDQP